MAKSNTQPSFETIDGNKILEMVNAPEGSVESVNRLTPLQQAGMRLAAGVGAAAFIIILGLGYYWMSHTPSMPEISTTMDATVASSMLDNYKTASTLTNEGVAEMFDTVIVKVLVPLFSLILGYVFGTGRASAEENNS